MVVRAVYAEGVVKVLDFDEANSLHQDGYGTFKHRLLTLTPCEALYLLERDRIGVFEEGKELSFTELLGRLSSHDERLWTRYFVYRDLRMRGYVVREVEGKPSFLVYERGFFLKASPSYEVYALWEGSPQPIYRLLEILRRAEERGKAMKIAVVDRRGEVVYYTLREMDFSVRSSDNPPTSPRG